jgi:hypothetical protein
MRLVGFNDLQGRTAYQPTIQRQGNRWIAYVGHHGDRKPNPVAGRVEDNGTSIVDVTDPAHPRYLAHIPGEEGKAEQGGAQMVRICPGATLPKADPSKFYMLRVFGNQAHEVWDVSAPERPSLITRIGGNLKGTHKNWWECDTGIAYLVGGDPQWRTTRMTQIYDLSDPARPVFIRNFGLVGQQPGATGACCWSSRSRDGKAALGRMQTPIRLTPAPPAPAPRPRARRWGRHARWRTPTAASSRWRPRTPRCSCRSCRARSP